MAKKTMPTPEMSRMMKRGKQMMMPVMKRRGMELSEFAPKKKRGKK